MKRPLEGIRVLDFTWWRAGPWATRILSVLGAEVIKVEWPEMPLAYYRDRVTQRSMPEGVKATLNNNGFFSENAMGKKSVTVNMRTPMGMDAVRRLIRTSDMVIENYAAGILKRRGLSYEEMKENPDLIYVSMAGLGHTGRYHEYKTFGPVVHALSGLTHMAGLPGKEPAIWRWAYMDDTGGMYAAMCALAALHHRNLTGQGQWVDLSQVSAAMPLTGAAWLDYTVNGRPTHREGFPAGNRTHHPGTPMVDAYRGPMVAPHDAFRTKGEGEAAHNAWCTIVCFSEEEWQRLVNLMGNPEWASAPEFATNVARLENQDELAVNLETWTKQFEKYELTAMCQSAGIHAMAVQDAGDRMDRDPQLQSRGLLQELPHPVLGSYRYQKLPFKGSEMDLDLRRPGPLAGEYNVPILCDLLGFTREELKQGYDDGIFWPKKEPMQQYLLDALDSPVTPPLPRTADAGLPAPKVPTGEGALAGTRILELGDVKGQWAGKLLGDLGADVIKVEPPTGAAERTVGPFYEDSPSVDGSLSFWHHNTSKRGVTLDLESESGKELLKELVKTSDILIDSYAPGYLPSIGLGYDELKAVNPSLIMCSVTSFGQTGPWRDYLGADLLHQAAGGIMAICGYDEEDEPDAPPMSLGGRQAWMMGGHYATIAIMAALHQRDVHGEGQYLDVSVHESCALTTEGHIQRYLSSGAVSQRNRQGRTIAKSQFRCKDGTYLNSQWSSEMTPEHLQMLAYWLDDIGMAGDLLDEKYENQEVISASTSHIAELLGEFFLQVTGEEAFLGAQQRGFAFGPVRTVEQILGDGHWEDRGFFVTLEHPELDKSFVYPGPYALYSATPLKLSRRAPTLGEHNDEILGELRSSAAEAPTLVGTGAIS